jgi:hypothetical protein
VLTADTHRYILTTARRLRPLVEQDKPAPSERTAPRVEFPVSSDCSPNAEVFSDSLRTMAIGMVDRMHVAEEFVTVARAVRNRIAKTYIYLSVPRGMRHAMLRAALKRHASNRQTYRLVMGEHPFPSEEMIGRAILGTQADRDSLLRHVDALQGG